MFELGLHAAYAHSVCCLLPYLGQESSLDGFALTAPPRAAPVLQCPSRAYFAPARVQVAWVRGRVAVPVHVSRWRGGIPPLAAVPGLDSGLGAPHPTPDQRECAELLGLTPDGLENAGRARTLGNLLLSA